MPRTVRMRPRKNVSKTLKVDKSCRIGRDFRCFQYFLAEHPDAAVRQLDSVEGTKGGAVLLTIHFVEQGLQLAFLRQRNDSQSVIDIFNRLYLELKPMFSLNSSQFSWQTTAVNFQILLQSNWMHRETAGQLCSTATPVPLTQKGSCENNHEIIRRIIPKGTDLGQYSQEQINIMMSHINSYSRKKSVTKVLMKFLSLDTGRKILDAFHLQKIPADEIILSPELLK